MEEEVCDAFGWWKIDLSSKSTCKCYTTGLCQSAAHLEKTISLMDWLIVFYIFLYIFICLYIIYISAI